MSLQEGPVHRRPDEDGSGAELAPRAAHLGGGNLTEEGELGTLGNVEPEIGSPSGPADMMGAIETELGIAGDAAPQDHSSLDDELERAGLGENGSESGIGDSERPKAKREQPRNTTETKKTSEQTNEETYRLLEANKLNDELRNQVLLRYQAIIESELVGGKNIAVQDSELLDTLRDNKIREFLKTLPPQNAKNLKQADAFRQELFRRLDFKRNVEDIVSAPASDIESHRKVKVASEAPVIKASEPKTENSIPTAEAPITAEPAFKPISKEAEAPLTRPNATQFNDWLDKNMPFQGNFLRAKSAPEQRPSQSKAWSKIRAMPVSGLLENMQLNEREGGVDSSIDRIRQTYGLARKDAETIINTMRTVTRTASPNLQSEAEMSGMSVEDYLRRIQAPRTENRSNKDEKVSVKRIPSEIIAGNGAAKPPLSEAANDTGVKKEKLEGNIQLTGRPSVVEKVAKWKKEKTSSNPNEADQDLRIFIYQKNWRLPWETASGAQELLSSIQKEPNQEKVLQLALSAHNRQGSWFARIIGMEPKIEWDTFHDFLDAAPTVMEFDALIPEIEKASKRGGYVFPNLKSEISTLRKKLYGTQGEYVDAFNKIQ